MLFRKEINKKFMFNSGNKNLIWVLLLIITLSAAFVITTFQKKADANKDVILHLVQSKIYYNQLSSIEWRLIIQKKADTQLEQELNYASNRLEKSTSKLLNLVADNGELDEINKISNKYISLIRQEMLLIQNGKFDEAEALDKNFVDLLGIMLEEAIDVSIAHFNNNVVTYNFLSSSGVYLTAIIAALLIGLLFWYVNSVTNQTAALKAEQATLLKSEQHFRSLIQNSSDVILVLQEDGIISYISPSSCNVLGILSESLQRKEIWDLFDSFETKQDFETFFNKCKADINENHSIEIGGFVNNKNKYFKLIGKSILDDPFINGIVINLRDVTQRRFYEQELLQQEKFLTNIFTSIQDGLMVTDRDYNILRANPTIEAQYNIKLPQKCYEAYYGRNTVCENCYCAETLLTGKPNQAITHNDLGAFENFSFPLIDISTREITGLIHYSRNITEKYLMEKEMARFEGLNLIGEIAASIAHEIRNPMTTVRGFLQLSSSSDKKLDTEHVNIMIDELDRANSIITEFLSLAKNRALEMKSSNLNLIVNKLSPLLTADAVGTDKVIKYELELIPDLNLDEKEIRQLILNLVRNGLEAMDEKGTLIIKTYSEGDCIVLSVIDHGQGITPEIFNNIGTPFLTSKEKGTGLGLAVCYSIAAKHNAKIEVETGSKGTTFYVKFKVT